MASNDISDLLIDKDLGPVSAYAMAVEAGYTGTEEQFAEDLANAGQNVQAVTEAARQATAAATRAADAAATASAAYNTDLLAVTFDQTKSYAKGQHVIYSGKYYVLPNGHDANVTWENTTKTEEKVGNEISDLKSALDDLDAEVNNKAPGIMGNTTGKATWNTVNDEKKVMVYGNDFSHYPVKLSNTKQLLFDNFSNNSGSGINFKSNGDLLNINGTATGNIYTLWTMSSSKGITIPSEYKGKKARFYIKSNKPCTVSGFADNTVPRFTIYIRKTGATGDGQQRAHLMLNGGISNDYLDSYVDFTIANDDDIVYFNFRYVGAGSTFDNVDFYAYLYPYDCEIHDTQETLEVGEQKLFDIPTGYMVVDTGVHQNALYGVVDTKEYVDSHIPSNVVTTESLAEYIPNEKNLVYVTPEMFGAVGNAQTDDSIALQAAINYAATNNVAMRAFGHYKTLSPLTLEGNSDNIYIHDIDYRGDGRAAFILHGEYNYIRIDRLYAYFSSGAAFVMETTATTDTDYNEIHLGVAYGYTNCIECYNNYGTSATGNKHFYYNKMYTQLLHARTANVFYLSGNAQMNENSFWGKHVGNQNGYFLYCEGNGNSGSNRFYEFCIESSSKNGVYGVAHLINCRTSECAGRKTSIDKDEGNIFVFDNQLPSGRATSTPVWITSVDVSNAQTYNDRLEIVKARYESGYSSALAFDAGFPNMSYIIGTSPNVMTYMANCMEGDYTQGGSVFAYYNHKGFIPRYDWYYEVTETDYYTWTTDHSFPTIFDIKANTTIHLDDSYCPIGIKQIKVIQTATEKATIYDHNNVLAFDGTNLEAGTYLLTCELLDPEAITIETTRGTISCNSRSLRGKYFGNNEKWTVEKLNIVS